MSRQRVFPGSVATETDTFSPLRSDLRNFKEGFYAEPGQHPETPTLCSAIYMAARARDDSHDQNLARAIWPMSENPHGDITVQRRNTSAGNRRIHGA